MIGTIQADQNISFQAMQNKLINIMNVIRTEPAVEDVTGFTGGGQRNSGFMYIMLKPVSQRKVSADQVIARLRPNWRASRAPNVSAIRAGYPCGGRAAAPCINTLCRPMIWVIALMENA